MSSLDSCLLKGGKGKAVEEKFGFIPFGHSPFNWMRLTTMKQIS